MVKNNWFTIQDRGDTQKEEGGLWIRDEPTCRDHFRRQNAELSEGDEAVVYEKGGVVAIARVTKTYRRGHREKSDKDGRYWLRLADTQIKDRIDTVELEDLYGILSGKRLLPSTKAMGGFLRSSYSGKMTRIEMEQFKELSTCFKDHESETAEVPLIEDINNIEGDETLSPTEKEALRKARVGQGKFRRSLVDYWRVCSVTGCSRIDILRASHIKPWRDSDNRERLDPYNGLLLTPNLDSCFEQGLITFDRAGSIQISSKLSKKDRDILHIDPAMRISVTPQHEVYLKHHRERFRRQANGD